MRSRIIAALLCILVTAATLWLIFKAPVEKPQDAGENPEETPDIQPITLEIEISRAYVIETAHDAEDLMENLAYGKVENYKTSISDLTARLSASAAYLKDELEDYTGSLYFTKLAEIFQDVIATPFTDSATFSQRTGQILRELENAYPADAAAALDENDPEKGMYYPKFDTEINGVTTLALLSVFRQQYQESTDSVLLTFGGNMVPGDTLLDTDKDDSFKANSEKSKYPYPLYKLSSVFSSDTATFGNLAAPMTDSVGDINVAGSVKGLASYAGLLKNCGIDMVSIANPDVLSFGESGKKDTEKALDNAKLSYTDEGTITYFKTDLGTVAYLSYDLTEEILADDNKAYEEAPKKDIEEAKKIGAKIIVVHFNWVNTERNSWDPCMAQVLTARAAVDNGADLVFGSHTAAIEGIERYNGVSIVYSAGDLFRKNGGGASSFVFQQAFTLDNDGNAIPGQILVLPLTGSGSEEGIPSFALDASSANAFRNTIANASSTVRYGVGRRDTFTLDQLNIISIQK